jgi:hypothetical protein
VNPTLGSLTLSESTVEVGDSLTLTAANADDADGTVASVEFFLDVDGNGQLSKGDERVGVDNSADGGWAVSVNTTGLPYGTRTFFARAKDDAGLTSAPRAVAATLNALPTVDSISVYRSSKGVVRLTANGVNDLDGYVRGVAFYVDVNKNGKVDSTDKFLAADINPNDTWMVPGTKLTFGDTGTYYLAVAGDNLDAMGPATSSNARLTAAIAGATTTTTVTTASVLSSSESTTLTTLLRAWARGQARLNGVAV